MKPKSQTPEAAKLQAACNYLKDNYASFPTETRAILLRLDALEAASKRATGLFFQLKKELATKGTK